MSCKDSEWIVGCRWPAGVTRPKVLIYRNDGGRSNQCVTCLVHTCRTLLDKATVELALPRAATRLFTVAGQEVSHHCCFCWLLMVVYDAYFAHIIGTQVKSVEQLRNHQELVASMGEQFRKRKNVDPYTRQTFHK